jgi:hypothetical protein
MCVAAEWRELLGPWRRFWYAPIPPYDLAACRIICFGLVLALFHDYPFVEWSEAPAFLYRPVGVFRLLGLGLLPPSWIQAIQGLWNLSLGLACLGIVTRSAALFAFVAGYYLLSIPNQIGLAIHTTPLTIFTLAILAASRCDAALALGPALRRRLRTSPEDSDTPADAAPNGAFRWPVQLVRVLFVLTFFSAGLSKLRLSGLEWVATGSLTHHITWARYVFNDRIGWANAIPDWLARLLNESSFAHLFAAFGMGVELAAPLALIPFATALGWHRAPPGGDLVHHGPAPPRLLLADLRVLGALGPGGLVACLE